MNSRRTRAPAVLCAGLSFALFSGAGFSARAEVPTAVISSPPAVAAMQAAAPTGFVDLKGHGFTEKEFFIEGTARKYAPSGKWDSDGAWATTVAGQEKYKTRMIVRAPSPQKFNGTVIVEWLNVSRGYDADSTFAVLWPEILDGGYAWVGVSAQSMGIDALKAEKSFGVGQAPIGSKARYGTLQSGSSDGFSYDIFSQTGKAVRDQAKTLLGGLQPKRVIAVGTSQSAMRLVTFINAVQPNDNVFQGFLLQARNRAGAPIDNVIGGASTDVPGPSRIRTDLKVPVLTIISEKDVSGYAAARQPDSALFRDWEVAGSAHAPHFRNIYNYVQVGLPMDVKRCDLPENDMPIHYIMASGISSFAKWIDEGKAPASLPKIDVKLGTGTEPGVVQRDQYGNGLGGIRLSQLTVPIARSHPDNSSTEPSAKLVCGLAGTTQYWTNDAKAAAGEGNWPQPSLKALYPTHEAYVAAVTKATRETVTAGFVLERDAKATIDDAMKSNIGK